MKFFTSDEAERYCEAKTNSDISDSEIYEIMNIAKEYSLKKIEAEVHIKLGLAFYNKCGYDKAYSHFKKAVKLIDSLDDKSRLGYIYNLLGACKYAELQPMEALQYFDKAIVHAVMFKDSYTETNSLLNSAKCYRKLSWLEMAIEYSDLCLNKLKDSNDLVRYISANIVKINCYEDRQDYDRAINLSEELLFNIQDKESIMLGNIYNNLGGLYLLTGDTKKSLENFDKSIEFRKRKDLKNLSHSIIDKTRVYIREKLYMKAVELLQCGCEMALEYNDYFYAVRGYKYLIEVYINMKNFVGADDVYTKIIKILGNRDSEELKKHYLEMVEFYIKQGKLDKADEYMTLSQ